jgi:D-alanyl-D-alanine carboxypeptidase
MAVGKNRQSLLNSDGKVGFADATTWDFIYETSTAKNPQFNIGDRVVLPDGRVVRYGFSLDALITPMACRFKSAGIIPYTAATTTQAVGDKQITVPAATHAAITKDELRGGYVIIFKGGVHQFRGITGNSASLANAAVTTIYLDGKLDATVTTSSAFEVYGNPWRYLTQDSVGDDLQAFAGPPVVAVAAASQYFWCQTHGPAFINPQTSVSASNGATAICYRNDGSLEGIETAYATTIATNDTSQIAGSRIAGDAANNGPLIDLRG